MPPFPPHPPSSLFTLPSIPPHHLLTPLFLPRQSPSPPPPPPPVPLSLLPFSLPPKLLLHLSLLLFLSSLLSHSPLFFSYPPIPSSLNSLHFSLFLPFPPSLPSTPPELSPSLQFQSLKPSPWSQLLIRFELAPSSLSSSSSSSSFSSSTSEYRKGNKWLRKVNLYLFGLNIPS